MTPRRARAGLLLTPGASATRDHSALVAIDHAVAALGVVVERINLPSRPAGAIAAINDAAAQLAESNGIRPDRVILGGRSFGGRMCSMAVAQGLPALALLLVSYPLHPPGKPQQLRVEHFPEITVPCAFVSGTRDAFATPAELQKAIRTISGPVSTDFVEGGNHGLRGRDAELAELSAAALRSWVL